MANKIKDPVQGRTYNGYISIHEWISLQYNHRDTFRGWGIKPLIKPKEPVQRQIEGLERGQSSGKGKIKIIAFLSYDDKNIIISGRPLCDCVF